MRHKVFVSYKYKDYDVEKMGNKVSEFVSVRTYKMKATFGVELDK